MSKNFFEDTLEKQKLLIGEQDEDLNKVGDSLSTIKHMSYKIGDELDDQAELLEDLDIQMKNTDIKMENVMKKIVKLTKLEDESNQWKAIIFLIILIFILFFILIF
ncbi:RE48509p [Strongyloides ratti]|uniref:RE48509p n=1 Tax=Strongyloides ratti TaxID=34506 RepID=A0A090LH20_STRRB|nr:RE48509p [Strongyloides ratti]CEF69077.1 RE48509p [Strongyloides ratti]